MEYSAGGQALIDHRKVFAAGIFLNVRLAQLDALVRVFQLCVGEGFVSRLFFRIGFRRSGRRCGFARPSAVAGAWDCCPVGAGGGSAILREEFGAERNQARRITRAAMPLRIVRSVMFLLPSLFRITPNLPPAAWIAGTG